MSFLLYIYRQINEKTDHPTNEGYASLQKHPGIDIRPAAKTVFHPNKGDRTFLEGWYELGRHFYEKGNNNKGWEWG